MNRMGIILSILKASDGDKSDTLEFSLFPDDIFSVDPFR